MAVALDGIGDADIVRRLGGDELLSPPKLAQRIPAAEEF
jgi:hypothetical protein